jgi:type IV secretion system protein VirB8
MTDYRTAFPLAAPMLEAHYRQVLSFHEARSRSSRFLSRGLLIGAGLLVVANIGLAWSVASMLPLTRLVPVYLLVRPDGTIDTSVALSTLPPSTDQAVIRAALWQYVQMREGYSYDTAQYRYDIVSGMSDIATRASYQSVFNYPNPLSPQVIIGKNGTVTVEPISVSLIGPNVAQIRFQQMTALGTNEAITTTWTSTVQFQQVDSLAASQRLTNPGGIVITNYQAEEDTTP